MVKTVPLFYYICIMEEQLVEFETAKLAKEKGFNEKCLYNYKSNGIIADWDELDYVESNYNTIPEYIFTANSECANGYITAPTQTLLQKWLREEHFMWVEITLFGDGVGTMCMIKSANLKDREDDNSRIVRVDKVVDISMYTRLEFNYEKTLEKGLQEALKLIK